MATAENIRRGMPPDEARRQALLASGGLTVAVGGRPRAARTALAREHRRRPEVRVPHAPPRPAFTAIVVVTLALGIGANTAIFSVMRGVLLKPLPHRDGDRLVYLRQSIGRTGRREHRASPSRKSAISARRPVVRRYRRILALHVHARGRDGAIRINVGLVTGNFFEMMGLSPILGRLTKPSDDGPGVPPVMVLTDEFWMKRFGGDPSIVGKQVSSTASR